VGKRILVTGATGFIGSHLCRKLLNDGNIISIFIRPNSDIWRIEDIQRDIKFYEVDLVEKISLFSAIKDIKPDVIYHFAANKASSQSDSVDGDIKTNILGTYNLLDTLLPYEYKLFVNAGSSSEYGTKRQGMRENDYLEPNSYHSFAKGAQTLFCQTHALIETKPIINLRFFSVYGPYERPGRLITSVIRNTLEGKELDLAFRGIARDFVYVDDVIDLCLKLEDNCGIFYNGEIFNVGTGIQSTIGDVVDTVFELTGKEVKCNWGRKGKDWDSPIWFSDSSKIYEAFGWKPKTSLREGLRKNIEWMKNR